MPSSTNKQPFYYKMHINSINTYNNSNRNIKRSVSTTSVINKTQHQQFITQFLHNNNNNNTNSTNNNNNNGLNQFDTVKFFLRPVSILLNFYFILNFKCVSLMFEISKKKKVFLIVA